MELVNNFSKEQFNFILKIALRLLIIRLNWVDTWIIIIEFNIRQDLIL